MCKTYVYKVNGLNCNNKYTDQIKISYKTRFYEHKKDIKNDHPQSKLACYAKLSKYTIDWKK